MKQENKSCSNCENSTGIGTLSCGKCSGKSRWRTKNHRKDKVK